MVDLVRRHRRVQLRAFYQAALFAAFNLFWTAAPLTLLRQFHFTQKGVALFALAGAGGALAAPLAGWMGDRGKTWLVTLLAHLILVVSFIVSGFTVAALAVIAFGLTAFLIDAAVQLNQVTGQKIIFEISREARSRINSIYMTLMFVFGATGSVIGSATYAGGGWWLSAGVGAAIGGISFIVFLVFDRTRTS
jgi:predicted MFS family arabinose efflux permease